MTIKKDSNSLDNDQEKSQNDYDCLPDLKNLENKTEIESSYGGELNWEFPRKSAFAIQQDYDDFLLSDVSRWGYWVEKMVSDMKRLDDATIPYYT